METALYLLTAAGLTLGATFALYAARAIRNGYGG